VDRDNAVVDTATTADFVAHGRRERELAGRILECDVSRAAVVRAAVQAWLTSNESTHPEHLVETIRDALVKRGRKRVARSRPREAVAAPLARSSVLRG
jgi:hypothetical protein